ncbi:MAG: ATP-binding protein [Thermoplasmata archaeon]
MLFFNISDITLTTVFYLVPFFQADFSINILFMVAVIVSADALLHIFDKRLNLMVSLMPTSIMISGIGLRIYMGSMTGAMTLFFVLLMVMIIFDILCIMEHPEELDIIGRGNLQIFLEKEAQMQERVAEEEEVLKTKEEELIDLEREVENLQTQVHEEQETLKVKEEEIEQVTQAMEETGEELMELEELLKVKEDNIENIIQSRVEEKIMEEEEFLRTKDEEVVKLQDELEAQRNLYEETKRELMEKEHRIENLKTEVEERMRREMEEEFVRKMKEESEITSTKGKQEKQIFPFEAIIGQVDGKRALILNAVYPDVGGVLLRGEKGTAKSVAVRGLAEVLPNIEVTGCRYNCDPNDHNTLCPECHTKLEQGSLESYERPVKVIDLPLNVTEDRLLGSLDIEMVLGEGKRVFEQGMLADAHRGILYVDEINLLDDYIVDILLDAASSKKVRVEREGISVSYQSDFIIVGSMNPEEGELRPQLLDRISLIVNMKGIDDIEERMNIIKNRQDFTANPEEFRARYAGSQEELKRKIQRAKELIPSVNTSNNMLKVIADLCRDFKIAGHRGDIAIERGARANAAFEGRVETTIDDILIAAKMSLPHRVKRRSMDDDEFSDDILEEWFDNRELN